MTMTNKQELLDHRAEVQVDYDSIEIDFRLLTQGPSTVPEPKAEKQREFEAVE